MIHPIKTETKMNPFVHLRVRSGYSFYQSTVRFEPLSAALNSLNQYAVALTDNGNMHGAIEFYRTMKGVGIKPILGCELLVQGSTLCAGKENSFFPLLLLAHELEGYQNLCALVSMANEAGGDSKPFIRRVDLADHHSGLVALSGGFQGEVSVTLANGAISEAQHIAQEYAQIMGENGFYLEIQRSGLPFEEEQIASLKQLSKEADLPLVATNDVRFLTPEDFAAAGTLARIGQANEKHEAELKPQITCGQWLRSASDMIELFADCPEAIANACEIAQRCNLELEFGQAKLPDFPTPEGLNVHTYLENLAVDGLDGILAAHPNGQAQEELYRRRLADELALIKQQEWSGYFLIVDDLVNHARSEGIPVGPGRGSVGGSLVAFALGITEIDPLRFNLPFERFMNTETQGWPEIDLELAHSRRDELFAYLARRLGCEHVAAVAYIARLGSSSLVSDVCSAFGVSEEDENRFLEAIQEDGENYFSLSQTLEENEKLSGLLESDARLKEVYSVAVQLEGLPHAATARGGKVLLSREPIMKLAPLSKPAEGEILSTVQYELAEIEDLGVLKLQLSGSPWLSIMERVVQDVNSHLSEGTLLSIQSISSDDQATWDLLAAGDTQGVFPFESTESMALLKEFKPDCFEDLVLLLSVGRPGLIEILPDLVEAKQGKHSISYPHPVLQNILGSTYGFLVYQEQVMDILAKIGGFSYDQANHYRKILGKRKQSGIMEMRNMFTAGAASAGFSHEIVGDVLDRLEQDTAYTFNRAHAVAYALLGYRCAYLKAHYPDEFLSSSFYYLIPWALATMKERRMAMGFKTWSGEQS